MLFLQTLEETEVRQKEVRRKRKKDEENPDADYKVIEEGIKEVGDKKPDEGLTIFSLDVT